MSETFMNTKEVARYLGLNEKRVYGLIREGRLPATRVTGKWLFPRRLIDEWLEERARTSLKETKDRARRVTGGLLAAGSDDPALHLLLMTFQAARRGFYIFTATVGSGEGLKILGGGFTDLAFCHLPDTDGRYNTPAVLDPHLGATPYVVVRLFRREVSLLAAPGNPLGIGGLEDALARRVRLVNRQKGSGTRLYIDRCLEAAGIPPREIGGYEREVFTHLDVGLEILKGRADVGVATTAVARLLGLSCLPLTREPFDMVLPQAVYFTPALQALLETLRSPSFREGAASLGGYDLTEAGTICHATA